MKCPKCQTENPEEASFCIGCGARVVEDRPPKCPACGTELPVEAIFCFKCGHALAEPAPEPTVAPSPEPTSFADGRYQVKRFLGEGGKKKVYLAHDTILDRDVAFALLKTEKLDEEARTRIKREAQAMGQLGDHPNIITIFELGEHEGQPYMVLPLMSGGDIEGLIEKAPDHKLPLDQAIQITREVCRGLEHAHSKGIIHRDLKPSNVYLTEEGTARIGDFGLAVATDVSRLTREGMMVGTVAYMPPEQAMGGKVTNKADLYSLGAMLYEMVTGRRPFIGDDSVAIIGQHINTPPVSPTWHRADLPAGLEALIMQLLEKAPEKRPNSASDVLKGLETVLTLKSTESVSQVAPAPTENPLYRRVFVGREQELKQLQAIFDTAMAGQGALMMVVGEPGIGKTAICEQLATYVTLRGGKTLVGHCYEEGSLSLPYLAFVEAMRSYVLERDADNLREELGSGATDVARIVSEVREKVKVEPRASENPEEDRYRLMQGVTGFLTNAASVQPLLIVLEDLHDADQGTLEMLTYVSRNLSGARLMLVGTYRDVEVDRNHPLSSALAELRRISTFGRVALRGLSADEVQRMLAGISQDNVGWATAEAVHRQTEGNPLFVQEVVRYLVEEGLLSRREGHWQTTRQTPIEMSIPEGLRDVIGKRLSLMSPECNRLLSTAAVIGREFRLEVLQKIASIAEDELFTVLREAKGAAVVEERSALGAAVTYRFAHAFFRQTLYEEIIAPRRIRLHQQVAQALEEVYATRLGEHAAELAEHFSYSSDPTDLAKAVSYSEMAAQRASAVFAFGEAVRLTEQALKVQEVLDPEDKVRQCDLLLALAEALIYAAQPRHALDVELPAAVSLAGAISDSVRTVRVCWLAMLALVYYGGVQAVATPEAAQWAERADQYAEPNTMERVRADVMLGSVKCAAGNQREGVPLLDGGLDRARRLGDPDTFWLAAALWMAYVQAPQHQEERLHLAEELLQVSRAGVSLAALGAGLSQMAGTFRTWGQRQRGQELGGEIKGLAERSGQANLTLVAMYIDALWLTWDGHLEEAVEMVRPIEARGEELGLPEFGRGNAAVAGATPGLYLGKVDNVLERAVVPAVRAVCLAHLGRDAEVAEILEQLVLARPDIGSPEDESPMLPDVQFLEAAVLVEHPQAAELLLRRFAGRGICTTGSAYPTCIARHLGSAAALLGRPDEARAHYQEALKVCTEMRFRPELALTRLQLAELLLEHYPDEKSEALEHLDFAISEFRDMKMQPSLERALKHKEILGA